VDRNGTHLSAKRSPAHPGARHGERPVVIKPPVSESSTYPFSKAFSVSTEFMVEAVRGSGHPRGIPFATRMAALQAEQGVGLNGTLACKRLPKARAVP
jgi:hypothetical protein